MHEDLLQLRGQFPILERSVYMISNSLGAMPRGVFNAMESFASTWATRGVRAWHEGWWEMPVSVGNLLCDILHAPHGSISMHQNVSIAETVLLSCFDFSGKRNKIVYEALNFPSVMYIMEEQKRRGARIVEVAGTEDGISVPIERLLEAIDEETLLVPVSHVLFRSAYIQDAQRIIERAHAVGARVILDVYQSAGTVPVDLSALNVDFAVGGSVKWLCGGPGAGYLYVRPDLAKELKPAATGWQAHARPFEFEAGAMDWGDPEFRFLNGTPHIPALYAAQEGYRIIRAIGTTKIRERSLHLTDLLLTEARDARIPVCCPAERAERGGTVALAPKQAARLCQELLQREIVVDYRPRSGVRVSPHFYSSEEECRTVVRTAAQILKSLPDV
jgi:kynureninase